MSILGILLKKSTFAIFFKKKYKISINGQPSATSTTRLVQGGMLSVKKQGHVLRHVMILRWFDIPKSCAFG